VQERQRPNDVSACTRPSFRRRPWHGAVVTQGDRCVRKQHLADARLDRVGLVPRRGARSLRQMVTNNRRDVDAIAQKVPQR